MGNLGKYQDIVTEAKRAGGVDNLIADIEGNAVAGAAPFLLAIGAGGGALVLVAARCGTRSYQEWKTERAARAEAAKAKLRAVGGSAADAPAEEETPPSGDEPGHEGDIQ
ncbi:hypothetical protein [Nocardioides sambongensis]|uniref:hypothetical protein n=1 Tax=Nocardioides sambongensis TaxID=2589074 RepID=UPI0011299C45|nr:hypothetical protein [Nocardioides sambongensis]